MCPSHATHPQIPTHLAMPKQMQKCDLLRKQQSSNSTDTQVLLQVHADGQALPKLNDPGRHHILKVEREQQKKIWGIHHGSVWFKPGKCLGCRLEDAPETNQHLPTMLPPWTLDLTENKQELCAQVCAANLGKLLPRMGPLQCR